MNALNVLFVSAALACPGFAQGSGLPAGTPSAWTPLVLSSQAPRPPVPLLRPRLKGLAPPLGTTDQELLQAVLRDLPGTVVVVEDQGLPPLARASARYGLFRLLWPRYDPAVDLPSPVWLESSLLVSGGNTIAALYPLGWGY